MNIIKSNKAVCLLGAIIALFFMLLINIVPSKADNHTILKTQISSGQESQIITER